MGHDCSFHLVDERQITDVLVPALLARGEPPAELAARFPDAAEIWAQVLGALQHEPPAWAAQKVCQVAVMLASCRLPHTKARGVALSLWNRAGGALIPPRGSPEPLFAALVAAHPRLAGQFPEVFESNYSTGIYYPPGRVAEALRWLEGRIAQLPGDEQERLAPLSRALRAAARGGHGWWEASDLQLVMSRPELLTAGEPPTGLVVHAEPVVVLPGRMWTFDDSLVLPDRNNGRALHLDLTTFPPRTRARAGVSPLGVARSRRGRWALLGVDAASDPPALALWLADEFDAPSLPIPAKRRLASEVAFVGERAFVFPERGAVLDEHEAPYPSSSDGGALQLEDGLPAAQRYRLGGAPGFVHGSVRLGDGADVLIWDGNGYERRDAGWQQTFATDVRDASGTAWTWAPAGRDGFYYLSDRQLFEIHRGEPPVRVLPSVDNIMDVRPGPGASLILRQGQNKQGHVARIYFPEDGRHAAIVPADFDLPRSLGLEPVFWSSIAQVVICLVSELGKACQLRALSEASMLAKKRSKPRAS